jgi:acylphosphatase
MRAEVSAWCPEPARRSSHEPTRLPSAAHSVPMTTECATRVGQTCPVSCYRVTVHGRVQGVWYRESCRRQAVAAGIAGWVRNNADGTVEAVVDGESQAVDRVIAWMRQGPPSALVASVEVSAETPTGVQGFSVR